MLVRKEIGRLIRRYVESNNAEEDTLRFRFPRRDNWPGEKLFVSRISKGCMQHARVLCLAAEAVRLHPLHGFGCEDLVFSN